MDVERQRLINQAANILSNINQLFADADYWNNNTRVRLYPNDEPINIDPDGSMLRWKHGLEAELLAEAKLGHFPSGK